MHAPETRHHLRRPASVSERKASSSASPEDAAHFEQIRRFATIRRSQPHSRRRLRRVAATATAPGGSFGSTKPRGRSRSIVARPATIGEAGIWQRAASVPARHSAGTAASICCCLTRTEVAFLEARWRSPLVGVCPQTPALCVSEAQPASKAGQTKRRASCRTTYFRFAVRE